jgi:signal transduction histidine kinase
VNEPLYILHLEDDPNDALIIQARCKAEGLEATLDVVSDFQAFEAKLKNDALDLILADYQLPGFDGLSALALARTRRPQTPFLFLTGALGEERAVETLRLGATDFILKDNLPRLVPAIRRAVAEAQERIRLKQAEALLRENEVRKRLDDEVVRAIEREQKHLSQELHESIAQRLVGMVALVAAAQAKLKKTAPSGAPELKEFKDLAVSTVAEIRDLAKGFYPVDLEEAGLVETLGELCRKTTRVSGLDCTVESDASSCAQIKGSLAIQLFRIAQEGLRNAVQYAKAKHAVIRLYFTQGVAVLTIEDDGVGFPSDFTNSKGMGLRIMQHRARSCGGDLDFCNAPSGGAMITCTVPLIADGSSPPYNLSP